MASPPAPARPRSSPWRLLALRGRCRGSRLKTYTNAYRAAWKSGEVLNDPEAVYARIKAKHLVFGESREEREVRVDGEHASLACPISGRWPHISRKRLGQTKRLWPADETPVLRAPRTWEESHKVVLEFEQREAAHKAVANAVYTASSSSADTAPSSASMSNPFAAFSIQIGSAGVQAGVLAAGAKGAESLRSSCRGFVAVAAPR